MLGEDLTPPKLADIIDRAFAKPISDEQTKERVKSLKRPKNMPNLMCPNVNPELFVKLNTPEENVDARIAACQQLLIKAAVAVGHAMSATMADKSATYQGTTLSHLIDAQALLG